jgi:hypothetical protein
MGTVTGRFPNSRYYSWQSDLSGRHLRLALPRYFGVAQTPEKNAAKISRRHDS